MAYERHMWSCNDPITTEKLNNIESGIEEALACCGSGAEEYLITFDLTHLTCDRTLNEIVQAFNDGKKLIACSLYGSTISSYYYLEYVDTSTPHFNFTNVGSSNLELIEIYAQGGQDTVVFKHSPITWTI